MAIVVNTDENGNIVIQGALLGNLPVNNKFIIRQNGNILTIEPDTENNKISTEEWIKKFDIWIENINPKGRDIPNVTFSRDELYD